MDEQQLALVKQRLLELRAEILEAGDMPLEPVRRDVSEKVDEDEVPLTEMLQVIASNRNRSRSTELQKIERALHRLERDPDEFGICRQCEEEIGLKRLLAIPWVELCVDCQAARDPIRGGTRRFVTDYKG